MLFMLVFLLPLLPSFIAFSVPVIGLSYGVDGIFSLSLIFLLYFVGINVVSAQLDGASVCFFFVNSHHVLLCSGV